MLTADLDELLLFAADTAKKSVARVISIPSIANAVRLDTGRDIKLEVDYLLEKEIIETIRKSSGYQILSEEQGIVSGNGADPLYRWIIDPLDGSLNFSRGVPISCVSIALWRRMDPLLGVVFDFNRGEIFTGLVGRGAWLNGKKIEVSAVSEKPKAVLCTGFPVGSDFSEAHLLGFVKDIAGFKKVRLLGSAALSLAYVAAGRADFYREDNIKIWDVAAGLALVKAAGGRVSARPGINEISLNVEAANHSLLARI